ncbi:AAA family ATPase [Paracoccus aestuariivivens]|uniref:AAA family ATPase n=1 Tax=Paracoccus aestuariivivens TaxID=1820333 RepID=A0A6L6JFR5_9RHOB|nr:AAA family ATPase [Paracoccus aestuariivivens]MTH80125.1 AAA family ATPase [Paracoccus aestuariivivens]
MSNRIETDINRLLSTLRDLARQGRRLVAVAGPPGSGKSTLCEAIAETLNRESLGLAAIVPMDGFHYDDAILRARGTLARKGAPITFDVGGLAALLARLRANLESEIAVPVFDRDLEISRAGARLIPAETPLLLVEGNYLLLDAPPWINLAQLFDLTVALQVPRDELMRRLIQRWLDQGMERSFAEGKVVENDLPNADLVLAHSRPAELVIGSHKV